MRNPSPNRMAWPLALLLWIAAAAGAPARVQVLPLDVELMAGSLRLELDDADVEVEILDGAQRPYLRARVPARGPDGQPLAANLAVVATAGGWVVRRPPSDGAAPRLELAVGLARDQRLKVVGRDLAIDARDPLLPADEAGDDERRRTREEEEKARRGPSSGQVEGASSFDLEVTTSQVQLVGVRQPTVQGDGSWIGLERTSGAAVLTVNSGTASVKGHLGALDVLATDSEVSVVDQQGRLELDLLGGSFDSTDGSGQMELKAAETLALVTGWLGPLTAQANDSTVQARGVPDAVPHRVSFQGSGSQWLLADLRGSFTVQHSGGSLQASGLDGVVDVKARQQAEVEIADSQGRLQLDVQDGSLAVERIRGQLEVLLRRGSLRLDGVERLLLNAEASNVDGGGVERLERIELHSSNADLDLSSLTGDATLQAGGVGDLELRLASPCVVQVRSAAAGVSDRVEVDGCDLRSADQAIRSARSRQRYGRNPRVLVILVDGEVSASVTGL